MSEHNNGSDLTTADLEELKEMLLRKRAEIVGDIATLEDGALRGSDEEVSVDHMADHGSQNYAQEQNLRLLERGNSTLREIQAALKRMEDGEYGVCERTGKPIGKPRLKAIPYSRLCLEAQMEEEAG